MNTGDSVSAFVENLSSKASASCSILSLEGSLPSFLMAETISDVIDSNHAAPGVLAGIASSGEPDVKCPFDVKVSSLGAVSEALACM